MKRLFTFFAIIIFLISFMYIGNVKAEDFDLEVEATILVDAETGQVLYEKNADKRMPPASITKIMTLLIAMEKIEAGEISLDDEVTISKFAESMGGSQIFLAANTRIKLADLLKSITMASANDSSVAVGEAIAGTYSNFITIMNRRAGELGMKNTHFVNSTGLPAEPGTHYSTARDISIMARELVKYPQILEWSSIWVDYLQLPNREAMLVNTNKLINKYPGMDGLKTGHTTEAGFSLAATAKRDNMRLISVILKADSELGREENTTRLLDFGFNSFEKKRVINEGEEIHNVEVPKGKKTITTAAVANNLDLIIRRGVGNQLKTEVKIAEPLDAPIKKGDVIGEKIVIQDGRRIGSVNIVATEDINKANIFVILWRAFIDWLGSLIEKIK